MIKFLGFCSTLIVLFMFGWLIIPIVGGIFILGVIASVLYLIVLGVLTLIQNQDDPEEDSFLDIVKKDQENARQAEISRRKYVEYAEEIDRKKEDDKVKAERKEQEEREEAAKKAAKEAKEAEEQAKEKERVLAVTTARVAQEEKVADKIPGWYHDPASPENYRFWDGNEWTDEIFPAIYYPQGEKD